MNELMIKQYCGLLETMDEPLSIISNTCAFISDMMSEVSWVGFYFKHDDNLLLGPFQGHVACTKLPIGQGVCGTCFKKNTALIVDDVHEFEGHIACDNGSKSEIVLPFLINNELVGVLDLDSYMFARFKTHDLETLSKLLELLGTKLKDQSIIDKFF